MLPNIWWVVSRVNSGLDAFDSMRRFAEYAAISLEVKIGFPALSFPVAEAKSSSICGMYGFWSGSKALSWPVRCSEHHYQVYVNAQI